MTETAMSFTRIQQEFHGRGARHEQLHQLVHTGSLMRQMEDLQTRLERDEARLMQATQATGSPTKPATHQIVH